MKKNNSFIFILVLSLVFSILLSGCNSSNEGGKESTNSSSGLERIKESGELVLGTSADYPPYEFHTIIDGKDEIVGFDISIAQYIADELGVKLVIKEMDFGNLLSSLSTGMVDMVIAGVNPTPEREMQVDFSNIYYEGTFSILVNKDSNLNIKELKDLEDLNIGVQMGTTQENIAKDIKGAKLQTLNKNPDLVMNLKTQKVDALILETPVAKSYSEINSDLETVEDLVLEVDSGGVAIAIQKDNTEFTEAINTILDDIKNKDLLDGWFVEAQKINENNMD